MNLIENYSHKLWSAGKILTCHSLGLLWVESASWCLLEQPPCLVCRLPWVVVLYKSYMPKGKNIQVIAVL